jgi:hypothetical protein
MPTSEQALRCFLLCQQLTNYYQTIILVTLDSRIGNAVVLAGEEIDISVRPDGTWRFE